MWHSRRFLVTDTNPQKGSLGWLTHPGWGHRPFQGAVSSEHPLVVVSTTHVEDWDESSSFLMEWPLQALPLASIDLTSAEGRVTPLCSQVHARTPRQLRFSPRTRSSQVPN